MRLVPDSVPADPELARERSAVARLMASGTLGQRLTAAARAAAAVHLAESARITLPAPAPVAGRPA